MYFHAKYSGLQYELIVYFRGGILGSSGFRSIFFVDFTTSNIDRH